MQGQRFTALNGGPKFQFNESVSFVVHCKDQKEVDYYGRSSRPAAARVHVRLAEGQVRPFLADRAGHPLKLMTGPNHAAVMRTFMKMRKFDVATLVKVENHKVSTKPSRKRVRITYRGEVIANTRNAVEMREGTGRGKTVAPVVYYVPRKDVKMDRLERSSHSTHRPFKGDASYFPWQGGPENSVWSYESPFAEAKAIRGAVAFYPDKLEISARG